MMNLNGKLTSEANLIGTLSVGGGGTGNYPDLENKPQINGVELVGDKSLDDLGIDIPTKTSELDNDSGYVNSSIVANPYDDTSTYEVGEYVTHDNNLYKCNTAITTAEEWNAEHWTLVDVISAIPTKTSELDNDSGFITGDNYYDKSEIDTALSGKADKSDTYTKTETDNKIVGLIDDNSTANNKAWSASKIDGELSDKASTGDLALKADKSDTYTKAQTDSAIVGLIDDTTTANNKAWSSSKITDEIINILPTGTASGSVASFNTSLALPLVSLKADVSATPSGVSEISLVYCGKNLYKYDESKVKTGTTTTSTTRAYYPLGFKGVSALTFTANLKSGSSTTASDYLNIGRLRKSDGLLEILSQFITPDGATTRTLSISSDDEVVLTSLENPTVIKSILSRYDVQIEVGSIATTYEEYNGNTEVINLGETIYNGGTFTQDNAGHRTLTADGTTISLPDGTPITTRIGTNNIYNDSGNTEVVYKESINEAINDAIAELQALFLS